MSSFSALAEGQNLHRYTQDLPQSLETEALSVLTSGHTYEIEALLCQRIKGKAGQDFQAEYQAWTLRNDQYIKASGQALTELGNLYIPDGGEAARQGYLQSALYAMTNAVTTRIANEMDGATPDNDLTPSEATCKYFAESFRSGFADFTNIPEETASLVAFMKRTSKP